MSEWWYQKQFFVYVINIGSLFPFECEMNVDLSSLNQDKNRCKFISVYILKYFMKIINIKCL